MRKTRTSATQRRLQANKRQHRKILERNRKMFLVEAAQTFND